MGKNVVVIPDSHAHPDYHNKRFGWAGELVADLNPDLVVMLGDWNDMPSLCDYDKGKRSYEGRRYKKDIDAGLDAQERFFKPIKARKRKLPRFVMLEGNHEYRIKRAISNDAAKLEGVISPDDLGFRDFGWEFVEYDGSTPGIFIDSGIAYAHYFISGIMGRAIGGAHPAYQLLQKQYMSCIQGHGHTFDYCQRGDARGKHIHGMSAGVFQDYVADFAGAANDIWWKGIVELKNVDDGQFDMRQISLHTIKKEYA